MAVEDCSLVLHVEGFDERLDKFLGPIQPQFIEDMLDTLADSLPDPRSEDNYN
jgi:hypothetical protein